MRLPLRGHVQRGQGVAPHDAPRTILALGRPPPGGLGRRRLLLRPLAATVPSSPTASPARSTGSSPPSPSPRSPSGRASPPTTSTSSTWRPTPPGTCRRATSSPRSGRGRRDRCSSGRWCCRSSARWPSSLTAAALPAAASLCRRGDRGGRRLLRLHHAVRRQPVRADGVHPGGRPRPQSRSCRTRG